MYLLQLPPTPKLHSVLLLQPFASNRKCWIETSNAPKAPQWLNTKRSKVPIYILQLPESKISVCFALSLAVFELHAFLRPVHRMTTNDLKHQNVKGTNIHVTQLPPNGKFQSVYG